MERPRARWAAAASAAAAALCCAAAAASARLPLLSTVDTVPTKEPTQRGLPGASLGLLKSSEEAPGGGGEEG